MSNPNPKEASAASHRHPRAAIRHMARHWKPLPPHPDYARWCPTCKNIEDTQRAVRAAEATIPLDTSDEALDRLTEARTAYALSKRGKCTC